MTGSNLDAVKRAWGEPPDWVIALARECDRRNSQAAVARELNYTSAVVNQVLRKRYPSLARIEKLVRSRLMDATVDCHFLGDLSIVKCREWRNKSTEFAIGSPLRLRMYRACRRCELYPWPSKN